MRVAVCFWGLTRSLKQTIQSIKDEVFGVLDAEGIEWEGFMHTYMVNSVQNNPRAEEMNIRLDNEEWKLLDRVNICIDDQDEVRVALKLEQQRTHPDPWGTNYICVDNFILAMYSRRRLQEMVKQSGTEFTHFIFLRPDVRYLNPLQTKWLRDVPDDEIYIPDFQRAYGYNDRFAICRPRVADVYGRIFDFLLPVSSRMVLHSERVHIFVLQTHNIRYVYIPFFFNRVRATGHERIDVTEQYMREKLAGRNPKGDS